MCSAKEHVRFTPEDARLWQSEPARRLLPGVLRKILAS